MYSLDQVSLAAWAQLCHQEGSSLDQIVDPFLNGKIAPDCLKKFWEIAKRYRARKGKGSNLRRKKEEEEEEEKEEEEEREGEELEGPSKLGWRRTRRQSGGGRRQRQSGGGGRGRGGGGGGGGDATIGRRATSCDDRPTSCDDDDLRSLSRLCVLSLASVQLNEEEERKERKGRKKLKKKNRNPKQRRFGFRAEFEPLISGPQTFFILLRLGYSPVSV
ncbi:hypothetical protein ACSBR2_010245 [Camellia fascicularis]